MTRQLDDYMENEFEICGEMYELVNPHNLDELMEAIVIQDTIQDRIKGQMHDEDSRGFCDVLQRQEDYIDSYLESIGEFDNSILVQNINYLVKKHGIRLGTLESILGISAGYISRTAKVNSSKKMSIDVVWRLAKLFGIDIQTLTEVKLWIPLKNINLVSQFLDRLYEDTDEERIVWDIGGGSMWDLSERFVDMGLVSEAADGKVVYHPQHLSQEIRWLVDRDIYVLENFDAGKDLIIIPYQAANRQKYNGYDCYFVWEEDGKWQWEKIFSTSEDPMENLVDKAAKLYQRIEDQGFDLRMRPEVKSIISNYVNGGRKE